MELPERKEAGADVDTASVQGICPIATKPANPRPATQTPLVGGGLGGDLLRSARIGTGLGALSGAFREMRLQRENSHQT